MPVPMPKTVKVGPHVYTVLRKTVAQMPVVGEGKPNGYCDKDQAQVCIAARGRRSKLQEWTIHEFLHAIWPDGDENEERHVTELAPRLLQLIKDNPELVGYLAQ